MRSSLVRLLHAPTRPAEHLEEWVTASAIGSIQCHSVVETVTMSRPQTPIQLTPAGTGEPLTSAEIQTLIRQEVSAAIRDALSPPVSATPVGPPPEVPGPSSLGELSCRAVKGKKRYPPGSPVAARVAQGLRRGRLRKDVTGGRRRAAQAGRQWAGALQRRGGTIWEATGWRPSAPWRHTGSMQAGAEGDGGGAWRPPIPHLTSSSSPPPQWGPYP